MLVRYFGAAQAAAGTDEEHLECDGASFEEVLRAIAARHPDPVPPSNGAPPMTRVLSRSSFLLNEVSLRDRARVLGPQDVLDVLPPFAGG